MSVCETAVSIYRHAEVLTADPLTFTSLAAVPGYSLLLLAVQWRTAEAAALAFAPLLTTHGNISHWPRSVLLWVFKGV